MRGEAGEAKERPAKRLLPEGSWHQASTRGLCITSTMAHNDITLERPQY